MSKLPRSLDAALRLGLVTAAAAAALAAVFLLTREPIAAQEQRAELAGLSAVLPPRLYDNDVLADAIEVTAPDFLGNDQPHKVYRAYLDGDPSAVAIRATAPDGYNGAIELLVGIRADGTLTGVRVVSHRETPGIADGIEVGVSNWIRNFDDRSLGNPVRERWTVTRNGGAFDQLSGATVTSSAIISEVERVLVYFEENRTMLFQRPAAE